MSRCSAGTYIRALARDLGAAVGCGAYLGALVADRERRLHASTMPSPLDGSAPRRPPAPCRRLLLAPSMPGWRRSRRSSCPPTRSAAIAKGQFVRPAAPLPVVRPACAPAARRGRAARRRRGAARRPARAGEGPAGEDADDGDPSRAPADPRTRDAAAARRARSDAVVPASTRLTPADGRLFVVVGVFDGLHLGHAYLLEQLARSARDGSARGPPVITFDAHPDEILHRLCAAAPASIPTSGSCASARPASPSRSSSTSTPRCG